MVSAVSFCHGRESSSHHTSRMQRGSECALSFSFLLVILSDPQFITGTVQYQGNSVSAITLTDTQKCTLVISSVLLNPIHSTDKIKRHRYQSGICGQIKKKCLLFLSKETHLPGKIVASIYCAVTEMSITCNLFQYPLQKHSQCDQQELLVSGWRAGSKCTITYYYIILAQMQNMSHLNGWF